MKNAQPVGIMSYDRSSKIISSLKTLNRGALGGSTILEKNVMGSQDQ
jgi:hypothetical protein